MIFDVVEYRQLNSSSSLRRFLSYNLHNYIINRVISKTDNVIVISKFLESFFANKGVKRIYYYPITFDVAKMPHFNKKNYYNKITFLYAGSPGGKRDLINEILIAFSLLNSIEKSKVKLFVCGINRNDLHKEGVTKSTISKIEEFTKILGKISKNELYGLMENINFTLLLKNENMVFSNAGFPTKMAESFSFGIPMLTNLSGDISIYLEDNFNGFISQSSSAKDFVVVLRKAIHSVEQNQHQFLSKNARATATEKLNTPSYIKSFNNFLNSLEN